MPRHHERRILPYSSEQLFDLVADVERYPEFVPGWLSARVHKKVDNVLHVEQTIGLHKIQRRFYTRTTLDRPQRVHVASRDAPFRYLNIHWHFAEDHETGCQVSLLVDYQMHSLLLAGLFDRVFGHATAQLTNAFERRAQQEYGKMRVVSYRRHGS